jgi:hypothetical protein
MSGAFNNEMDVPAFTTTVTRRDDRERVVETLVVATFGDDFPAIAGRRWGNSVRPPRRWVSGQNGIEKPHDLGFSTTARIAVWRNHLHERHGGPEILLRDGLIRAAIGYYVRRYNVVPGNKYVSVDI